MASNFDSDKYLREDWKTAKEGSSTHYDRLGLAPGRPYTPAQVDEAYLPRYLWWKEREKQKASGRNNPLIREVGDHIKTALDNLLSAKNCLSDAETKCVYDNEILAKLAREKEEPFLHNVAGALLDHELSQSEKTGLFERARELGITRERAQVLIWEQLKETGSREVDESTSTGSGARIDGGRRKPASDPPELIINQTNFPLGTLRRGDKREAVFTIDNRGGGTLQGHFTTSHPHWLHVSPSAIIESRHHQEVKLTVDTSKLALGAKCSGVVKVHSNGGTQTVTVEFSVEVEKDALARFRQGLFWLGFCGGGLFGYFFYHFLPAAPTRDVITGIAGLLGIVAAMVVGGRSAGFGGGCTGLILSLIVLGALQKTWPEGFSTFSWAITYGTYLHTVSRSLFVGKQTQKAGSILVVAAAGILLLVGTLAAGYYFSGRALPLRITQTASVATVHPSFSCAKARTPTESLICRDSNLATSELAMVAAYNNVFMQRPMEQKAVFRREQVAWLRDYGRTCDASLTDDARRDCIASHLADRTRNLEASLSKMQLQQVQSGPISSDIIQFLRNWRDTFLSGNFDAHMECYAPTVESYYQKHNLTRDQVRREREGMIAQYGSVRQFDISNVELSDDSPGRAGITLKTHWELSGKEYFAGEDMEKLALIQTGGKWLIASEEEPTVFWVQKGPQFLSLKPNSDQPCTGPGDPSRPCSESAPAMRAINAAGKEVAPALSNVQASDDPAKTVLNAFDAYIAGNADGVTRLMSDEGARNAKTLCPGDAAACLRKNYSPSGSLDSRSALVISRDAATARVRLMSYWHNTGRGATSSLQCQTYDLSLSAAGWRINSFSWPVPTSCQ